MPKEEGIAAKKVHSALDTVRTCVVGLIIAIIIGAILFNAKSINIDNVRRIISKIDFSLNTSAHGGVINFSANENNMFTPFKGGIAVQSLDGLSIYDKSGNKFSNFDIKYKNPILKASPKYLLCCDKDGKTLKITNSFAVVFEKEFQQKIVSATMGNNGSFAVITTADGYKSTVTVFSSNFKEEFSASFADRYVVDIALSSDGQTLAVAALVPEKGITNSVITLYKTNAEKPYKEITLPTCNLFRIAFRAGDSLIAISPETAYFYNKAGEEQSKLDFEGGLLLSYDITNPEYTTFVVSTTEVGAAAKILISDNKKAVTKGNISEVPISISELQDGIALLYRDKLVEVKYSHTKIAETDIAETQKDVLSILSDENTIYLLHGNKITSVQGK